MSKKDSVKRIKTSIIIDEKLWHEFRAALRKRGSSYAAGIEILARQFLEVGYLPGVPQKEDQSVRITREELHLLVDDIIDLSPPHSHAIYAMLELLREGAKHLGTNDLAQMRRLRQLEQVVISERRSKKLP